MECTVHWVRDDGMAFVAETGSGHLLTMDGGCAAYDVVTILRRGRHDVHGCSVKLQAERAAADPKVFTRIHLHFVVTGRELDGDAVARAVALSHDKYCSATAMLAKTAEVSTSYELVAA